MAEVGYRTGVVFDDSRANWQNSGARPIAWSAWYPAGPGTPPEAPAPQVFNAGGVRPNAPLAPGGPWPVVLMSHGTGGTAESLGWLARSLAHHGYVVLAPNHHGNTGLEPYAPEGFLCWWERATDMSRLLSSLAEQGVFADHLDLSRVSAAGFSLGAYTVIALAGAQSSLEAFDRWRAAAGVTDLGPREFPDAGDHIDRLLTASPAFQSAWARAGEAVADPRITSFAAIAPPPPVRAFTPPSLAAVEAPLVILTGGADVEAPSAQCADWLMQQNDRFTRHDLGRDVGHYTFLEFPADRSLIGTEPIFTDAETVDRATVHRQAAEVILSHIA